MARTTIAISSSAVCCVGVVVGVLTTQPAMGAPNAQPATKGVPLSLFAADHAATTSVGGSNVELSQILAFADTRSPILRVARSTRSRARAARIAASPILPANPELSVAVGPRLGTSGNGVDVDLSLSQRIRVAGERGLRLDAADRLEELTDAEIQELRWSVHCDVHATFHRALVMRERDALATRLLSFQDDLLRVVEKQISAGEVPPLNLRLARAEVAQAHQSAVAAHQAYLSARIQLAQLSGWSVESPPVPVGSLDVAQDPPPLSELVARARVLLPALRARAAAIREASARVAVADREVWPQPTLGVQYRREGNPAPEGVYNVVLGTLSLPIPSFDTNQGERARSRADLAVATAQRDATQSLLEGQIAQARAEMVSAAQRVRSYGSEVLPNFEENLTLLRRSFELGEIDLLALSIGRERFLSIQRDALDAQNDYFAALANLERSVGSDIWRDEHSHGDPR